MGKVQLQPFKADGQRAARGSNKVRLDPLDVLQGHGLRHFRQVCAKGDGRGCDSLPAVGSVVGDVVVTFPRAVGTGLAAGVGNLNAGHRAVGLDTTHNRDERLGLGIGPQAGAGRCDAALRCHCGGFDNYQTGAATGLAGVVGHVPVVDHAVGGRVLAHRRYRDAVAQGNVFEREGLKQS